MSAFEPGDPVTVKAIGADHIIIQLQRSVIVARVEGDSYWVRLVGTTPGTQEFGPFPADRLERGWKDEHGQWRS